MRMKNQNWSQWSNSDSKEVQEEISQYYEYYLKSEDVNIVKCEKSPAFLIYT